MTGRGDRIAAGLARAYLAAVAGFAVAVSLMALRDHHRVANFDDWRILDDLFSSSFSEWVLGGQVGHLFPVTLALFYLDYAAFSGRMHLMVTVSLACALLASVALWRACRRGGEPWRPLDLAALGFAVFALYWSHGGYAFLWGMMHGNLQTALLLVVGIALLARASSSDGGPTRLATRRLLLVCAAATGATFSHGSGFAVFPALVLVALAARVPGRTIAVICACAALVLVVYVAGLRGEQGAKIWFNALIGLPTFVAAFLGSAVGVSLRGLGVVAEAVPYDASLVAGSLGLLGLLAWVVQAGMRRAPLSAIALVGLGLAGFGLATAFLVGTFRLGKFSDAQAIASRFLNFSAFFWSGLGLLAASLPRPPAAPRVATAGVLAFALVSALALPGLRNMREVQMQRRDFLEMAALELQLGIRNGHTAWVMSFGSADVLFRTADRLRREGLNLFHDALPAMPGEPLAPRFSVRADGCRGGIDTEVIVPDGSGYAARLRGWAWDEAEDAAPALLIVSDRAGTVRGVGRTVRYGQTSGDGAPWVAYVPGCEIGRSYVVHALSADGTAVCEIDRIRLRGDRVQESPMAGKRYDGGRRNPADAPAPDRPRRP